MTKEPESRLLLNEALRLLRVYHDLKQAELVTRLGVTKSYISELEAGNKTPSFKVLESYAKAFSIPLSSILFFAENIENPSATPARYIARKIIKFLGFVAERATTI